MELNSSLTRRKLLPSSSTITSPTAMEARRPACATWMEPCDSTMTDSCGCPLRSGGALCSTSAGADSMAKTSPPPSLIRSMEPCFGRASDNLTDRLGKALRTAQSHISARRS
jgi:hypothetical protein